MTEEQPLASHRRVLSRLAKAEEFLLDAQDTFQKEHYDTSVSRAYYAAFHAIKALLIAYGRPEVEHWEKHHRVLGACADENRRYTWFTELRPLAGRRDLRRSLLGLYSLRLKADYEVGAIGRADASEALVFVRSFLSIVKEKIDARKG